MKGLCVAIVALTVCVLSTSAHFYAPPQWGHIMHHRPSPHFIHQSMPFHRSMPFHQSMPFHHSMPSHDSMPFHHSMPFDHPMPFHQPQPQYPGPGGEPPSQRLEDTTFARGLRTLALLSSSTPFGVTAGLLGATDLAMGV